MFLTETCDVDKPRIISNVITTVAGESDINQTAKIHDALEAKALLPVTHLADAAFVNADLLVKTPETYGVQLLGPVRIDSSWQAKEGTYDIGRFNIDWSAETMTCPQGKKSSSWTAKEDPSGNELISVKFRYADCSYCETRNLCTRNKKGSRQFTLKPKAQLEALSKARITQQTLEWREQYKARSGIESTMSQGVRANNLRRSRYVGLGKTALQHVITSVAINVQRVTDWLGGFEIAPTRVSSFAHLQG